MRALRLSALTQLLQATKPRFKSEIYNTKNIDSRSSTIASMNQDRRKRKPHAYRTISDAHEKDAVRSEGVIAFNGGPLPLRTVHPNDNFAIVAGAHKKKERMG